MGSEDPPYHVWKLIMVSWKSWYLETIWQYGNLPPCRTNTQTSLRSFCINRNTIHYIPMNMWKRLIHFQIASQTIENLIQRNLWQMYVNLRHICLKYLLCYNLLYSTSNIFEKGHMVPHHTERFSMYTEDTWHHFFINHILSYKRYPKKQDTRRHTNQTGRVDRTTA